MDFSIKFETSLNNVGTDRVIRVSRRRREKREYYWVVKWFQWSYILKTIIVCLYIGNQGPNRTHTIQAQNIL